MKNPDQKTIKEWVRQLGGPKAVAEALSEISTPCTPAAVCQWVQIPASRVIPLERISGGELRREQMRPDLYPVAA